MWKRVDPDLRTAGERAELDRFYTMIELLCMLLVRRPTEVRRARRLMRHGCGITRVLGSTLKVPCRLVAQELGYGGRLDELFAGALGLTVVSSLLF